MSSLNRAVAVVAVVAAIGCGGPRNIGQLPDGGAGLPGTWDVIITPTGSSASTAVVLIGVNTLNVSSSSAGFTLTPSGSTLQAAVTGSGSPLNATATRSGSDIAGGIIPFDLGGTWNLGGAIACNGSAGLTQIDSTCTGSATAGFTGTFTTTRTSTESSDYGDLGGAWSFHDNGGATCTIEFNGATMTTNCSGAGSDVNGLFSAQFNGNTVSGTAPNNVEFVATRRAQ